MSAITWPVVRYRKTAPSREGGPALSPVQGHPSLHRHICEKHTSPSEHRHQVVLFGIHLAVYRAQYILGVGARDIWRQGPAEREFVALLASQIPLIHFPEKSLYGEISLLFGGVRQHDQKLVSALTKCKVGAAEDSL